VIAAPANLSLAVASARHALPSTFEVRTTMPWRENPHVSASNPRSPRDDATRSRLVRRRRNSVIDSAARVADDRAHRPTRET
jgi:hypothetical protein